MGVICLFFLVPYFAALSSLCATPRRRAAAVSDRRFSLLNQVISGIRAIKTHAWEDEFRGKIKRIRRYVKRCTNWFRSSRERCGKIFIANPGRFIECFLEQLRSTMFKYVLQLKWNETNFISLWFRFLERGTCSNLLRAHNRRLSSTTYLARTSTTLAS